VLLIVMSGKFRAPGQRTMKGEDTGEVVNGLLGLEGEKIEVVPNNDTGKAQAISDDDLNLLLDRSPAVYEDRVSGWVRAVDGKKNTSAAFEVFEATPDEGSNRLAKIFGEDVQ